MYSINNNGKPAAAERFVRTLKAKIYKYMTSVSKNVYIDKSDDIVGEYYNTYHRKFKMKPTDVKDNTYIDFKKEVNDKDAKFKIGDTKMFLLKDTHQTDLKKFLFLVKLKIHFHGHMLLMISVVKKLLENLRKRTAKD